MTPTSFPPPPAQVPVDEQARVCPVVHLHGGETVDELVELLSRGHASTFTCDRADRHRARRTVTSAVNVHRGTSIYRAVATTAPGSSTSVLTVGYAPGADPAERARVEERERARTVERELARTAAQAAATDEVTL